MAIQIYSTKDVTLRGVKALVYGISGAGKTVLCSTAPDPIIISAESGLLSIADKDIAYIEVSTLEDLYEAYSYVVSPECLHQTICLDSISEIAEKVLSTEKKSSKDPRQAYGSMQDQIADIIRAFRDIPHKNVLMTSKISSVKDENGIILYAPSMPGEKASQGLPYFFDEVFALRVERDEEGTVIRSLQTAPDGRYQAKDRSGKLPQWMEPDFTQVIDRIKGEA